MKSYSEELARLTFDYANTSRLPDQKYIDKLADIVVNGEDLNDYIKRVKVCYRLGFTSDIGYYLGIRKIIKLGFNTIIKKYYESELYSYELQQENTMINIYQCFNQAFLHECDHAKQFKICYENPDGLEAKILYPDFDKCILEKNILDKKSWDSVIALISFIVEDLPIQKFKYNLSPAERLAEIRSYKKILEIDKILNLEKLYQYHKYELFDIYLDSYMKKVVPTLSFFKKLGYKKEAEEIEKLTKNLDFDTRLQFGLDITEKEFKRLVRKQDKAWEKFINQN